MTKIKKGDVVTRDYDESRNEDYNTYVVLKVRHKDNHLTLFNLTAGWVDGGATNLFTVLDAESPYKVVSGKVDGYNGYAFKRGKEQYISVGCRVFNTLSEAKTHWAKSGGDHDRSDYDDNSWAQRLVSNAKRYEKTRELVAKLKEKN